MWFWWRTLSTGSQANHHIIHSPNVIIADFICEKVCFTTPNHLVLQKKKQAEHMLMKQSFVMASGPNYAISHTCSEPAL